jgi:hypothetical protein
MVLALPWRRSHGAPEAVTIDPVVRQAPLSEVVVQLVVESPPASSRAADRKPAIPDRSTTREFCEPGASENLSDC